MRKPVLWILCLLIFIIPLAADETDTPPIITADNITELRSITQIDFTDAMNIASGWFALSSDGQQIAVVHNEGGIYVFDAASGGIAHTFTFSTEAENAATVIDVAFSDDDASIAILLLDEEGYFAAIDDATETLIALPVGLDMPVRIWFDADGEHLWLEVLAISEPHYVMRLPIAPDAEEDAILKFPSGPENDLTAFVRIGRIPAPLAITAGLDGLTKLWDLETGDVTAEVQLEMPPVFGRIDETNGTHLAWRDQASTELFMLNFATGENQTVAPLFGDYVQAFMVTPPADLILGVAIEDDPVVVAWDVQTGERLDLGEYRPCSRVPDMVRLSRDGTTLVIGCDTGFDIWKVNDAA